MTRVSRTVFAIVTLLTLSAVAPARAIEHPNGALGFHSVEAPVGIRWWLSDQVGIDAGLGFSSTPAPSYSNESLTGWAIDVGVPIMWRSWDRANLLFRPGVLFESQQFEASSPPAAFSTNDATSFTITAEIEAEIFVVENISVSASHGIGINSLNPPGPGDNRTSFGTIGRNFTTVGFHVYLWGN